MFYHLQAMNMIFFKLFLICTFKDANLAENLTNLTEFMELVFFKSGSSSHGRKDQYTHTKAMAQQTHGH